MSFKTTLALVLVSAGPAFATLQVIGTGFPRTGTESLRDALRKLNYSTFHMADLVDGHNAAQAEAWRNFTWAGCANASTLMAFFEEGGPGANSTAAVGFPASRCWAELLAAYPQAVVVHTQRRDAAIWWASASATVLCQYRAFPFAALAEMLPFFHAHRALVDSLWRSLIPPEERPKRRRGGAPLSLSSFFTFPSAFEAPLIRAYEMHNAAVLKKVPRKRLLVLDVDAPSNTNLGWGPLCAFLGRAAPVDEKGMALDLPFPHVNARADYALRVCTVLLGLVLVAALIAAFAVLACCFFRQESGRRGSRINKLSDLAASRSSKVMATKKGQ